MLTETRNNLYLAPAVRILTIYRSFCMSHVDIDPQDEARVWRVNHTANGPDYTQVGL